MNGHVRIFRQSYFWGSFLCPALGDRSHHQSLKATPPLQTGNICKCKCLKTWSKKIRAQKLGDFRGLLWRSLLAGFSNWAFQIGLLRPTQTNILTSGM
jgi:hypothetical protein